MVTINYRLGCFGFFSHPELTAESDRTRPATSAVRHSAALQWVTTTCRFRRRPSRVTIAGESAGSMGVHDLIASPIAKGLFQHAIAESGGSTLGGNTRKLAEAEADGVRLAADKGAKSLADLRALTPSQLTGGRVRYGPVVDGYLLTAPVDEIVAQGKQNDVPILTRRQCG